MSREPACVGVTGAAALNVPSDLARRHRQPGVCRRAFWPAVGGQVHGAVAVSRRAGNVRRLVRSRGVRTEKRQTSDRHPNGVRPSVHASFIERPVRQRLSGLLIAQRRGWCHHPNPVFWTHALCVRVAVSRCALRRLAANRPARNCAAASRNNASNHSSNATRAASALRRALMSLKESAFRTCNIVRSR